MATQRVTLRYDGAARLVMVRERIDTDGRFDVYFDVEVEGEGVIKSFYQLAHAEVYLEMLHGCAAGTRSRSVSEN